MPLSDNEFNRRLGKALDFLGGLLHKPERIDDLPPIVHVPGVSVASRVLTQSGLMGRSKAEAVGIDPRFDVLDAPRTSDLLIAVNSAGAGERRVKTNKYVEGLWPFTIPQVQTGQRAREPSE